MLLNIFPPWDESLIIVGFILLLCFLLFVGYWFLGAHYFRKYHVGEKFYVISCRKRIVKTSKNVIREIIIDGVDQGKADEDYFIPKGNKGEKLKEDTWYELVLKNDVLTLVEVDM
jgi:hypothetical protein